jgi:NADH-quinone oxidoreductase subunit I
MSDEAISVPHGAIRLIEDNCTSCMICARECPSWCISIDSHTEPIADLPAGARERTVNVLDRFAIDWSLCMYCGICVEECPFDALEWAAPPLPGRPAAAELVHEIEELRDPDGVDRQLSQKTY